ncbi:hypothetical protein ILYODFUR_005942 [Ilyodon furcidens]|uniref:Uncharacterized protein n=1 Tax=Ilyodon furcidens TaxID=33524 RepID=A0ABV0TSC6_9TELE
MSRTQLSPTVELWGLDLKMEADDEILTCLELEVTLGQKDYHFLPRWKLLLKCSSEFLIVCCWIACQENKPYWAMVNKLSCKLVATPVSGKGFTELLLDSLTVDDT